MLSLFPTDADAAEEQRRAADYPISRWYLRPAAGLLAALLAPTRVRPIHLTTCGLVLGLVAAVLLAVQPAAAPLVAALVLATWFCDRADGQLARRQKTTSALGAWFDANVDELLDVAWHLALAAAIARQTRWESLAWMLVLGFLAGKYLFMHGLFEQRLLAERTGQADAPDKVEPRRRGAWLASRLYHLPANADVRVHLLAAALALGWLTAELAFVAAYYNLRWIARYALVFRSLGNHVERDS